MTKMEGHDLLWSFETSGRAYVQLPGGVNGNCVLKGKRKVKGSNWPIAVHQTTCTAVSL